MTFNNLAKATQPDLFNLKFADLPEYVLAAHYLFQERTASFNGAVMKGIRRYNFR